MIHKIVYALSSLVFDALDRNQNAIIEFSEFIEAMSVLRGGSLHEKLHFSFRLCDPDKDSALLLRQLVLHPF